METLLLIFGIITLVLLFFRPAPRAQIIYVPVEVAKERSDLGCLPLIVAGVLALLILLGLGRV